MVEVETTEELEREALERAEWADVVLMAAAVADYRPAQVQAGKRERGGTLVARARADGRRARRARRRAAVPARCSSASRPRTARTSSAAEAKRVRKGVDLIVLNDVSRGDIGFDVDDNEVVARGARTASSTCARAPKRAIAARRARPRAVAAPVAGRNEIALRRRTMRAMEAALAEPQGAGPCARRCAARDRERAPRGERRARGRRARSRGAAGRGPRARRGRAGRRQDDAGARAGALARLLVRAHPVHARPAAERRHRRQRVRPAHERVRVPAGPRLRATWCSRTRSTARRRARSRRCSSACRSARSRSTASRDRSPRRSW